MEVDWDHQTVIKSLLLQGAPSYLDDKMVSVLKHLHCMPEMPRWKVCVWDSLCHLAPPLPSSHEILHGFPAWQHNMLLSCQMLQSCFIPNWWPKRFCLSFAGGIFRLCFLNKLKQPRVEVKTLYHSYFFLILKEAWSDFTRFTSHLQPSDVLFWQHYFKDYECALMFVPADL